MTYVLVCLLLHIAGEKIEVYFGYTYLKFAAVYQSLVVYSVNADDYVDSDDSPEEKVHTCQQQQHRVFV